MKIQDLSALLRLFGNMLHQGHGDVLVPEILVHQQAVHADIPIGCENIAITHQLPAQIRAEVGQLFPEVPVVPHGKIISVQRAVVFQFVLFQLVCVRGLDRDVRVRFPAADVCFRGQNHRQGLFALHAECIGQRLVPFQLEEGVSPLFLVGQRGPDFIYRGLAVIAERVVVVFIAQLAVLPLGQML